MKVIIMINPKFLSTLLLIPFLGACAATTPTLPAGPIGNATANVDGTYTVTANATTYELGRPAIAAGDTLRFYSFTPGATARGFSNTDVTAIGGILTDGTAFSGISGTLASSVSTAGTADFSGRWTMAYIPTSGTPPTAGLDGTMSVAVDFDAGTMVGNPNPAAALSFTANISGVNFTGTATCNYPGGGCATTAPLEGAFYGTDALAAVFAGPGLAGAIYVTLDP